MSRFLGPTRQLGFVVPDIEEAMRHWSDVMGVGPFFIMENIALADMRYMGQPTDAERAVLEIALGQPVFRIEKIVTDAGGGPLALSRLVTPGHLVSYVLKT